MKTSAFIFLLFLTYVCQANGSPAPIRDTNKNPLHSDTNYLVLPATSGSGGGLETATTRNVTCPLDVSQAKQKSNKGLAVNFTPANLKTGGTAIIRSGIDLNIRFPNIFTVCGQLNVWRFDEYDGERVVSTDGVLRNPRPQTLSNWFSIETYEDGYKFVFCPTVCNFCKPNCGDVSVSVKNGSRRLIVGRKEKPFKVIFKKAA